MDTPLAAYIATLAVPSDRSVPDAAAPSSGMAWANQLRATGTPRRLATLAGAHLSQTVLLLASWILIGRGALSGRLDRGYLIAWAMCLGSTVFLQGMVRSLQGTLFVGFSGLLKERLLASAMKMDPQIIRCKGMGKLLSETLDVEAIEALLTNSGFEILLASLELLVIPLLLAHGAAAGMEIALFSGWIGLAGVLFLVTHRQQAKWTTSRLGVTHRAVENMTAHRTRVTQQAPEDWHENEDTELRQYSELSSRMDSTSAWIEAMLPRGYVIAAIAVLAPSFVGGKSILEQQAITLGTILFAGAALERLTFAMPRANAAWISWRRVKPTLDAASASRNEGAYSALHAVSSEKVLQADEVVFTHPGRTEPILKGCSVAIRHGDYLLLQGDSGSGKSTIAAVLAGLCTPSSGLVLSGGLDRATLGDAAWRSRVAFAPQYHENHILSASLAFNLLIGRPYPHSSQDKRDALEVCRELGLGPLLERMPAGLEQMVGETGWQLSQGERSRVFLARTLLQRSEVLVLDETLAALDPENLEQCLQCVMRRAETVMLIAHL